MAWEARSGLNKKRGELRKSVRLFFLRLAPDCCKKQWDTWQVRANLDMRVANLQDVERWSHIESNFARITNATAHASRRLLMLRLKSCSLLILFTTY